MVVGYQLTFPFHPGTPSSFSVLAILSGVSPCKKSRKIRLTILACSSLMIRFPFSSLSKPTNLVVLTLILPRSNFLRIPQVAFPEIERDSSWAKEERIIKSTSPLASRLSIFSFSKATPIPSSLSSRTYFKQSSVFLEKRLMDFTMILSTLPFRQSAINLLNSVRFLVLVPEIPSSA